MGAVISETIGGVHSGCWGKEAVGGATIIVMIISGGSSSSSSMAGQTALSFQDALCDFSSDPYSGATADQLLCPLLAPRHSPSLLLHHGLNPGKGQLRPQSSAVPSLWGLGTGLENDI